MAKGKVMLDISTTGLCLSLYNLLNALGFVTTTVGTPTAYEVVFSSPLLASPYYFRINLYSNGSYYYKAAICMQIGTVSGSTFTVVNSLIPYGTGNDISRTILELYYDTENGYFMFVDDGYAYHGVFIGTMASGKHIGFSFSNITNITNGVALDLDSIVALGGPLYFGRAASFKNKVLAQPLKILSSGGNILMNGETQDYVKGILNVALKYNASKPLDEIGGLALFGCTYVATGNTLKTYFGIQM